MDETTELQMNQQYTYIPSTYTDIHIMYDGDPDVIIEPADASGVADGDTTLRFRTGVLFADTYEWRVAEDKLSVVSEDLSWNEVAQHCTYSGVNSNTLLLTPKAGDTWLDGKCVYCVVWRTITLPSRNDTSWARITLTAPTLPEFEILKQPPYGNCTVGESMVFDVEARGVSNYVWRICEDGTYQTYDWSEVTQHASYTADQNKITIQPTDTWLNDKLIYCDMYGADGTWLGRTSLRDMIVKEAEVEPPHTHSLKTKTTRATLTKNGKIEKVCDCGYIASTTTIYHPVNYDLSTIQYVYNGKVKAPKLNILDTEHNFIPSTYYTVEKDAGRKEVGKYAYTITFKGRYSGTKKVYFTILPPAASIKTLTARTKGFLVNWTQKSNGVSGYQVQYSRNSSFKTRSTLTLTKNTTTTKTVTKLLAKKRYYVRVRTYKKVGNTTFFSQWSDTKSIITKS